MTGHTEVNCRNQGGYTQNLGRGSMSVMAIFQHLRNHRAHQLQVCAKAAERQLQQDRATVNRSRTPIAHAADWLSVRHHQRAQVGGRAAHASGLAVVHRVGLRSGKFHITRRFPRTGMGDPRQLFQQLTSNTLFLVYWSRLIGKGLVPYLLAHLASQGAFPTYRHQGNGFLQNGGKTRLRC